MKFCENCGNKLEDDALFCDECGAKQDVAPSPSPTNEVISNGSELSFEIPDDDSLELKINGIPLNLKYVKGKDYDSDKEILDFYIGETPVTQALWYVMTGNNPSNDISDLFFPVTNITPTLITSFLIKLSKVTGLKFDLPTQEQWEFAYQGGNKSKGYQYSGSNSLEEIAWTDKQLHQVAGLYANELGLFDMEGNIEELLKGGQWAMITKNNKKKLPDDNLAGFRLVLNLPVDEKLISETPLQEIIAQKQSQMISSRDKIVEANRKKKEEDERIKAEEEARKKAEEEARKKAEEEAARLKAEEEARKKAEGEARKKALAEAKKLKAEEEARAKAAKEAQEKIEKESRIEKLQEEIFELKATALNLNSELVNIEKQLKDKKKNISDATNKLNELQKKVAATDNAISALDQRYQVVLHKRVEYSLFSTKGKKFDETLTRLTGADSDKIKKWNSDLKNGKQVVLSDKLKRSEAEMCQLGINGAGGRAVVNNSISDKDYGIQYDKLTKEKNNITSSISEAKKALTKEKESQKKIKEDYDKIESQYNAQNREILKAELELGYLESNKSLKDYIKEKAKDEDNLEPLSKLFPEDFSLWEADQLICKKKDKNGFVKYAKNEEEKFHKLFLRLVGSQYQEDKEKSSEIEEEVKAKLAQIGDGKWKTFGEYGKARAQYGEPKGNYKGKVKYALLNKDTLVLKGEGDMPDFLSNPFSSINMKENYWKLNEELEKKRSNIRNVVITGKIKTIGKANFKAFDNLKIAILPESIQTVKDEGVFSARFCNIEKLSDLKEIGLKAFRDLNQTFFFVPVSVKQMNDMAFGWNEKNIIMMCKETKIEEAPPYEKALSGL